MKYLFLLFFSALPLICSGQESINKQYSIRTGLIFDYSNVDYTLTPMFLGFSKYNKSNNLHIIELQQLILSKKLSSDYNGIQLVDLKENLFKFYLSYQYVHFVNKIENKIRPYIGYSIDLGFSRLAKRPYASLVFPTTESELNPNLKLNLGFNYNLTKQLYVDFCIPIDFVDYKLNSTYIDNPVIKEELRRVNSDDINFFSFDYLRLKFVLGLRF
jgi:hypothetical protein